MFISPAYAQGFGDSQALVQFLPLILIFVVFYFLLIRPQQTRAKEHKAMLAALRRGDRVVTGGGIIGTVAKVMPNDEEVAVDIAENVRIKVLRGTITTVLAKTEPVSGKDGAKDGGKDKDGSKDKESEGADDAKDKRKTGTK